MYLVIYLIIENCLRKVLSWNWDFEYEIQNMTTISKQLKFLIIYNKHLKINQKNKNYKKILISFDIKRETKLCERNNKIVLNFGYGLQFSGMGCWILN